MAVIREKRNFRVGPIGVARADEGGRIVGEAIAQSANQAADIFFREGLRVAERVGEEAGQAADSGAVLTINPQTGQPEAYTPPAPFGTAAAEAYQRVVQRRFEQSMDDEMRTKSAELAARYESNPNGAALYESAMSDYIAAMSENATGQFKGYIADTGSSYLNLTRSNLAINQMRRERAAAAAAQAEAAQEANNQIGSLVSQYGPAFLETSFYENMAESGDITIADGTASGLLNPNASTAHARQRNAVIASGLIEYAARNAPTSREAFLIREAVQLRDANLVPEGYEYIAQSIVDSRSDPELQQTMSTVANSFFSNRIEYLSLFEDEERLRQEQELANNQALFAANTQMQNIIAERARLRAEAEEQAATEQRQIDDRLAAENLTTESRIASSQMELRASNPNVNAVTASREAVQSYEEAQSNLEQLIARGDDVEDELIEAARGHRDRIASSYAAGLHNRLVRDENGNIYTREQLIQIETAIDTGNIANAPANARQTLYALRNLTSSLGRDVYDFQSDAKSFISGIGDGSALETERLLREEANAKVSVSFDD